MKKSIVSFLGIIHILMLVVTPVASASNVDNMGFTDVASDIWYAVPVAWGVDQNITSGTTPTTFSPNLTCTNAQVLTFIWRACGAPGPMVDNPFTDLTGSEYYYEAAIWAYANDMVEGPFFRADKPCTRSMAVTYLWRVEGSPEVPLISQFTDVNSRADFAPAVAWAVSAGVTAGTSDTTFSPESTCTRAHIITFLYRNFAVGDTVLRENPGWEIIEEADGDFGPTSATDSTKGYLEIKP